MYAQTYRLFYISNFTNIAHYKMPPIQAPYITPYHDPLP